MIRPLPYGVNNCWPTFITGTVIFAKNDFSLLIVTLVNLQLSIEPDDLIAQFKYWALLSGFAGLVWSPIMLRSLSLSYFII